MSFAPPLVCAATHFYFGPEGAKLFGALHAGAPGARLGVVLCNPFGIEETHAHRAWRHLAEACAAAGLPTLRFDYAGTGDSEGDDLQPERVPAWTRSVHDAVQALKQHSGVRQVCLVGLRWGATLAALAATGRQDVVGLAAIVPVVQGRRYLRELTAMQAAMAAPTRADASSDTGVMETGGFVLTEATRDAVAAVDLMQLPHAPAPQMLVLARHDLPGHERWAEHLRQGGAQVVHESVYGYVEMMTEPQRSVVPELLFTRVAQWAKQLELALPTGADEPVPLASAAVRVGVAHGSTLGEVMEQALRVGGHGLTAVLTCPPGEGTSQRAPDTQATAAPRSRRAVLLLNAGAVHHIGPSRMYVDLARRLALRGLWVLRVDLSGIGESPPQAGAQENEMYSSRALHDLEQAVRHLRELHQVQEVHAAGLCAGAYHVFKAAAQGVPLASIVALNPVTFFWKDGMPLDVPSPHTAPREHQVAYMTGHYKRSVWTWRSWRKLVTGGVDLRWSGQILTGAFSAWWHNQWREWARRCGIRLEDDLALELQQAAGHGTQLRFLFARAEPGHALLRGKGGSTVDKLMAQGRLELSFVEDADHTFTSLRARMQVLEQMECWLAEPPVVAAPGSEARTAS